MMMKGITETWRPGIIRVKELKEKEEGLEEEANEDGEENEKERKKG